jgi:hypothetical protein
MCKQLQHLRRHAGLTRRHPCDEPRKKTLGGEISAGHKANRARPAVNVKREVRLISIKRKVANNATV